MSRKAKSKHPLTASKDAAANAENIDLNNTNKDHKSKKKGFFGNLFSKKDDEKKDCKQSAAITRRKRRPSKLAEDIGVEEGEAKVEENQIQEEVVNNQENVADAPPPPPPPPKQLTPYRQSNTTTNKPNTQTAQSGAGPLQVTIPTNVVLRKIDGDHPSQKPADNTMDMMEEIRLNGRKRLRKTSIRRSIGGTPIKDLNKYKNSICEDGIFAQMEVRDSTSDAEEDEQSSDSSF